MTDTDTPAPADTFVDASPDATPTGPPEPEPEPEREAAPAGSAPEASTETEDERVARLEREGDAAADYLEGLLDIADLDGDLDLDVEGERALVSIVAAAAGDLDHLVGRRGEVLEALQDLVRLAVQRETGERSRLMLDIAGFREQRRRELSELGSRVAARVLDSREPERLDPMTPFERKVVHDAVAAAGARSESEGEAAQRRVVVHPV